MAGQSLEESLGDGWTHAVHPDDRDGLLSVWESAIRTGQEFFHEFRLLTPIGDVRSVSGRAKEIVSDDGSLSGYVGTLEDVTYQRQQEADLFRTKNRSPEMVSLESKFKAHMSHEVRTLMNVIIGMTDLALDTTLTREQREYLESVKFSAHALLTVIDGIFRQE
jgi:PAS domain S-box-containing protein